MYCFCQHEKLQHFPLKPVDGLYALMQAIQYSACVTLNPSDAASYPTMGFSIHLLFCSLCAIAAFNTELSIFFVAFILQCIKYEGKQKNILKYCKLSLTFFESNKYIFFFSFFSTSIYFIQQ